MVTFGRSEMTFVTLNVSVPELLESCRSNMKWLEKFFWTVAS